MPKNTELDEARIHLFSNKTRIPPGILHSKSMVTSQPPSPNRHPLQKHILPLTKDLKSALKINIIFYEDC